VGYLTWRAGIQSSMSTMIVRDTTTSHAAFAIQFGIPHSFFSLSYTHRLEDMELKLRGSVKWVHHTASSFFVCCYRNALLKHDITQNGEERSISVGTVKFWYIHYCIIFLFMKAGVKLYCERKTLYMWPVLMTVQFKVMTSDLQTLP
jgi:hypothetical protein